MYVSFKKIILLSSLSMFSVVSTAQNLDKLSKNLDAMTTVVENEKLKLEIELMLKQSILIGIEKTQEFNEAAGFNSAKGHYTAIPAALLSLSVVYLTSKAGTVAINAVTPSWDKMKAFLDESRNLNSRILRAEADYNEAVKRNYRATLASNQTAMDEAGKDLSRFRQDIESAKLNLTSHLSTKPGAIYNAGRAVRGMAKLTLFSGALTVGFAIGADLAFIWFPEDTLNMINVDQLKKDVQDLNQILYPNVSVE